MATLRSKAIRILQAARARAWHTRFRLEEDGSEIAIFGSRHVCSTYHRVFFGERANSAGGKRLLSGFNWTSTIASAHARCALTVIHGAPLPGPLRAAAIPVPRFVRLRLRVPPCLDTYVKALPSGAKRDIQRVRAAHLTRELSCDANWSPIFKSQYHDPSVAHRHGNSGLNESSKALQHLMERRQGEFIRVMSGDLCVAAAACSRRGDVYFARSFGWLDGSDQWLHLGAMCAVYWFMVQRTHELGCTALDLDGAPPFLTNGLFAYKTKWGAEPVPAESKYPLDHLLLNPTRPGWRRFVEGHPIIAWGPDSSFEVHSVLPPSEYRIRPQVLSAIQRWHLIVPPT